MLQGFGSADAAAGRAGLSVQGARAALACVSGAGARQQLDARVVEVSSDADGEPMLDELQLAGRTAACLRTSTVLPDGSYQLLLEELPNVPREELQKAIGWRVRDRIDMPLEDAIIELFDMPEQARAGSKPSAYAAITARGVVENLVRRIRQAGFRLDAIDLPELCLRNIAVRLPQDANGVAFLHFTDDCGLLTITRGGVLYLIRRIDVGQLALDRTPGTQMRSGLIPTVCLELQRSLDYYETHYDCRPVTELVFGPGSGVGPLQEAVRDQLGLNVSTLDLADLFATNTTIDETVQHECLLAVGAALRCAAPEATSK